MSISQFKLQQTSLKILKHDFVSLTCDNSKHILSIIRNCCRIEKSNNEKIN